MKPVRRAQGTPEGGVPHQSRLFRRGVGRDHRPRSRLLRAVRKLLVGALASRRARPEDERADRHRAQRQRDAHVHARRAGAHPPGAQVRRHAPGDHGGVPVGERARCAFADRRACRSSSKSSSAPSKAKGDGGERRTTAPGPERTRFASRSTTSAVAWITLDRPEVLNALTVDNRRAAHGACSSSSSTSADVRAIVLTGAGRGFCSGADLRTQPRHQRAAARTARGRSIDARRRPRPHQAMLECHKPIVGAINGVAAGVGVQMALACDLLVAADDARFVQVFARRGIVPDGGAALLPAPPRRPQPRRRNCCSSATISVPPKPSASASSTASCPATSCRPRRRRWRIDWPPGRPGDRTDQGVDPSIARRRLRDEPRARSASTKRANARTEDAREGLMSFVERRTPSFKGR